MTDFRTAAEQMRDQLIAWRRDLHRHPELAFQEQRTAGIAAAHLSALGYRVQTGVGKTGVIGVLEGARPGPVVMLRFDMDALPITEENDVDYASEVPGCMHACGHDAHVAIGLGVAQLLAARQGEMAGTLKLVFQPAEEGGNGADEMIRDGALENPRPDVFLALHVWADRPVGTADITPGPVMAAAEKWTCTLHGHGGHGAMPHQATDPIVAAAQVITALQSVVSRDVSPLETAVVSVGAIHAGEAFNVIPNQAQMTGTIRTFAPSTREVVLRRVRQVIEGVAAACGSRAELEIIRLTPAVVNDPQVTEVARRAAEAVLGPQQVHSGERTMGSEDAAFFMERVPGCFIFLGSTGPGQEAIPHHNPRFTLDEQALPLGVAILTHAAASYLG